MASPPDGLANAGATLSLSDGRQIGYLDIGDPAGQVLVSCHGGLSSRLDVAPATDAAIAHGLRILSVDRPGIGLSDRLPDRVVSQWPDDLAELLDQLGVDRISVMGWSFGGVYAQAVAALLGDRVDRALLVASALPTDWPGVRSELNRMDRFFTRVAERAAPLDRSIFHLMHFTAVHAPKVFLRQTAMDQELVAAVPEAIAEGLTNTAGVVDEYRAYDVPWGFSPSDIPVPVLIWHGEDDDLCPKEWASRLAEAIPDATLTMVPDANHFLWYAHWDDLFSALSAP